jgi:hypothetical protein
MTSNNGTKAFHTHSEISKWGPSLWKALHTITLAFPADATETEKTHYSAFFRLVGSVLPCQECADHYSRIIKSHPPDVRSCRSLAQWLIWVHNQVNVRLGKRTWDLPEVIALHLPESAWGIVLSDKGAEMDQARQHLAAHKKKVCAAHSDDKPRCTRDGWFWAAFISAIALCVVLFISLIAFRPTVRVA